MYLGKRKGRPITGDFRHAGTLIKPQEVFHEEDWDGSIKSALHYGKCYVASNCSIRGFTQITQPFSYDCNGNPFDLFVATLSGPKWHPLSAWWESPRRHSSAMDFIDLDFHPDEFIRNYCRRYVPAEYLPFFDGSYINVSMTATGFSKMIAKLEGVRNSSGVAQATLNVLPRTLIEAYMMLLSSLDFANCNLPFDASEKVCNLDIYRHKAALGFDAYRHHRWGDKGFNVELNKQVIRYFMFNTFNLGESVLDFAPCPGYVMAMKPEVRGPDVSRDKVRMLMTNEMFTDWLKDLIMRPNYEWFKGMPDYLAGINVRGNFIPKMLYALKHPLARKWYRNAEVWDRPCAVFCFDIGAQDNSYSNEGKHLKALTLMLAFANPFDNSKEGDWIERVLAYLLSITDCNYVQLWGDVWSLCTGNLSTGDKFTAILNYLMAKFNHYLGLRLRCPNHFIEVSRNLSCLFFGDDEVVRVPVPLADRVYGRDLKNWTDFMLTHLNVNYKYDQSYALYPTHDHLDRVFTWIEDDKIVSRGANMLKRHLIKIDKLGNPLHPDATDFHTISLWRETPELVSRFALDPLNWAPGTSPWIKWFRKQFGLIIDAGCNRTVHNFIKAAVLDSKLEHPKDWEIAYAGLSEDNYYMDMVKKFGDIDPNLMTELFDDPDSFVVVCSLFLVDTSAFAVFPSHVGVPTSWVC